MDLELDVSSGEYFQRFSWDFLANYREEQPQDSGLFDEWRIPIVTCVSWFGAAKGGAFTFYPDGRDGERQSIPASHNSAILIDTDTVFHGVERVAREEPEMPEITQDTRLHYLGDDQWQLRNDEQDNGFDHD